MTTTKKHFAVFLSPGTFVAESTERELPGHDIAAALAISSEIRERHGAVPYGFRIEERIVSDDIDDGFGGKLRVEPRTVETSGMYFIDAELLRFEDVPDDERHETLRFNMRVNGYPLVARTSNGYVWHQPFERDDCVVYTDGRQMLRGDSAELDEYRRARMDEWEKERSQ